MQPTASPAIAGAGTRGAARRCRSGPAPACTCRSARRSPSARRRSRRGRAPRPSPPSRSSRAPMPPYFSGLVRPSRPSSPRRLNTWCAGNASAASHSSTCGLISSSMKRLSVRWISSCSCVNCMRSPRRWRAALRAGRRRTASGEVCAAAASSQMASAEREHAARVARVDHAVVEQQARGVEGVGLALEGGDDLRLQRRELRLVDRLALSRRAFAHHDLHRAGGLLAAHHRGLARSARRRRSAARSRARTCRSCRRRTRRRTGS